jgi:hypothetical protein
MATSLCTLLALLVQILTGCEWRILDGCRRDKDGYFWLTGRVDDVINVSGAQFTRFTSTRVQILTLKEAGHRTGTLLYWYKSTNSDADRGRPLDRHLALQVQKYKYRRRRKQATVSAPCFTGTKVQILTQKEAGHLIGTAAIESASIAPS